MKIAVLMSTYNGEKYLKEQIDSILSQKLHSGDELVLFIRDDGSPDQTCTIIDRYTKRYENVLRISLTDPAHLGIKESFLLLLKTAAEWEGGFDYFAFSDQDDVWLEDKLAAALERLEESHNEKGALYYSNKFITDRDLHVHEKENIRYYGDFTEILCRSRALGNTMVFNDSLAKYASLYHPQAADFHDVFVYRLAKCIGADIFFDENSHIYYRQNSDNVVGYKSRTYNGWLYTLRNILRDLVKPRRHYIQNQIREIVAFYQKFLDQKIVEDIDLALNYNKKIKCKWALLTDPEMKKRPIFDRCLWVYKILFNIL